MSTREPTTTRSIAVSIPTIGLLAWAATLLIARPSLAESMLLFAPLVLLPLAWPLTAPRTDLPRARRLHRFIHAALLPAALCLPVAWLWDPGEWSGALTIPWLALSVVVFGYGLSRFAGQTGRRLDDLCISAGCCYLVIGALWTFFSRCGAQPLGFSTTIGLLTGVHFHYAGFALPVLTAFTLAAHAETTTNQWRWNNLGQQAIAYGVVFGITLVGLGITFSPVIEVVASIALAAACGSLATIQWRQSGRLDDPIASLLLAVSSLSLVAGMILAAVYALGEFTGDGWIDIPAMIPLHGTANAFGFALCGVLARRRERRR